MTDGAFLLVDTLDPSSRRVDEKTVPFWLLRKYVHKYFLVKSRHTREENKKRKKEKKRKENLGSVASVIYLEKLDNLVEKVNWT